MRGECSFKTTKKRRVSITGSEAGHPEKGATRRAGRRKKRDLFWKLEGDRPFPEEGQVQGGKNNDGKNAKKGESHSCSGRKRKNIKAQNSVLAPKEEARLWKKKARRGPAPFGRG